MREKCGRNARNGLQKKKMSKALLGGAVGDGQRLQLAEAHERQPGGPEGGANQRHAI